MIQRFEIENYRGFSERLVFDLTSRDYSFNTHITKNGLVNKAIIYGKNGVGKSALGLALFDIISHLTDKKRIYKLNYRNLNHPDNPVAFKYFFRFSSDEVIYEYEKQEQDYLLHEKLTVNSKVLIDYNYFSDIESERFVSPEIKGNLNIDLIDNKLSVLKYIYRNTPTNNNSPLTKIIQFCEGMLWYRSLSEGNSYMGYTIGVENLTEIIYKSGSLTRFESFLQENGLDYNLEFKSENGMHILYAYFNDRKSKAPFTSIASTGTMSLLLFFAWSTLAFKNVTFLFIDEFDAFFHYESAELIVRLLNKYTNFQSILTTHNTYLMQNRLTRPDCCFLMTHDRIANLYDSTDREIREAHNLEKMYINGAFIE